MWNWTLGTLTLYQLVNCFLIYSVIGWMMETVVVSFSQKRFVKRGFLNGPLCPIYGTGMAIILLALDPIKGNVVGLFIGGMLLASALEYLTGWAMEKIFHAQWWDYSHKFCNLHGRICLFNSLAWGFLSLGMVLFVQPALLRVIDRLPAHPTQVVLSVLVGILAVDTVFSIIGAGGLVQRLNKLEALGERIRTALGERLDVPKAQFEAWKQRYEQLLSQRNPLHRRLLSAFPRFKSLRAPTALADLKQRLFSKARRRHDKNKGN